MSRCRHGLTEECRACEDIGEQRAAGEHYDPIGPDEWDALEAGPWWNSYPGMGAA